MKRLATTIAVALFSFALGWAGALVFGRDLALTRLIPQLGPGAALNSETPEPLRQQFGIFWEVWNLVESQSYQRQGLDSQRMIRGAIDGMLASLDDPYTVYQEPELAKQTAEHMQGKQAGIGTYLRITDGRVYLWKPFKNGPAVAAGLRQDDELLAIDGQVVSPLIAGLSINDAAVKIGGLLRGDPGTQLTLKIGRAGAAERDLTLTRAEIVVPSVEGRMLSGKTAYLRIGEFKTTTTEELDVVMRELLAQRPTGFVLDLRNDPGGYLDQAREVLGRFYSGVALYQEDGERRQTELRTSDAPQELRAYSQPVVVLVNGGSASASEIVAGGLRDARQGVTLLGEKSYGKGSVQNIFGISNGGSARITVTHWLTPNKSAINKVGIVPQYVVPYSEDLATPAPCVADRLPADGQTVCGDSQLYYATRLLETGAAPPVPPA